MCQGWVGGGQFADNAGGTICPQFFTEPHSVTVNADAVGSHKRYFVKQNNNLIVGGQALYRGKEYN